MILLIVVSQNLRFFDDDHTDYCGSGNSYQSYCAAVAHGMESAFLWPNIPLCIISGVVIN